VSERTPAHRLEAQGIETSATVHWNLTTSPLVEQAVSRGEGKLAKVGGALPLLLMVLYLVAIWAMTTKPS